MTVTTRWHCSMCDNICEKRPFFKFYPHGRKTALGAGRGGDPSAGAWKCSSCQHPPFYHTFTLQEPKREKK